MVTQRAVPTVFLAYPPVGTRARRSQVMRVLGVPLPFYKSPTLLLGWGVSPFVFWQLLKARPDVIHAAFPGASAIRVIGGARHEDAGRCCTCVSAADMPSGTAASACYASV